MNHQYVKRRTLQKQEEWCTKLRKEIIYLYVLSTYRYIPFYDPKVCTRYILFTSSMYQKHTFNTGMYHIYTWYIPVHSQGKQICTWCILFIPNLVQTFGKKYIQGTYLFMLVYIGTILMHGAYLYIIVWTWYIIMQVIDSIIKQVNCVWAVWTWYILNDMIPHGTWDSDSEPLYQSESVASKHVPEQWPLARLPCCFKPEA
jgi:hypothetical protein